MSQITGLVIGILGLAVFGISMARLASGRTVYFATYRAVAVYVPISAALGIGIALAMILRWRKGRHLGTLGSKDTLNAPFRQYRNFWRQRRIEGCTTVAPHVQAEVAFQ
jgi:hypothetical protein